MSRHTPINALIVVDVQRDFCPGGSLPVPYGDQVAANIHEYLIDHGDEYRVVVASKDWHPKNPALALGGPDFTHFSDTPNYINTWPPHCVEGTPGADFHPNLHALDPRSSEPIPTDKLIGNQWIDFDAIFYKGQQSAAYSAFEGYRFAIFHDGLDLYLHRHNVGHVDIVGLATDHCVFATAMDAVKRDYDTTVLLKLCEGVDETTTATAIEQMREAEIHLA